METDPAVETPETSRASTASRTRLPFVLAVILTVAALVIAVTAGHLWGTRSADSATAVSSSPVDAGFVRDMSTHHTQAVTMAGYERDNSANASLKLLAFDIETGQEFQIGQMQGWLDAWGLARQSSRPEMAWMGGPAHMQGGAPMPGMASPAQVAKLESLHGPALDTLFLQLMIHHHQGGLPMAQFAADHAGQQYVRELAQSMLASQGAEIVEMERLLRQLGSAPLPPPTS